MVGFWVKRCEGLQVFVVGDAEGGALGAAGRFGRDGRFVAGNG